MALPNLLPLPALNGHQAQLACSAAGFAQICWSKPGLGFSTRNDFSPLDFQTYGHLPLKYKWNNCKLLLKKISVLPKPVPVTHCWLPRTPVLPHFSLLKERIHVKNHLENHFPATLGSSPLLAVLLLSVPPHLWCILRFGAFTILLPPQPSPRPLLVTTHIVLPPSHLLLKGGYMKSVTWDQGFCSSEL